MTAVLLSAVLVYAGGAAKSAHALNDGLARTPPMGWNDWNAFQCNVSEALVQQTADFFVSSGMREAGYEFVNIDDCWAVPERDSDGNLVPNAAKFPNGIQAVADYVHARGLKFGIYATAGTHTCNRADGFPGSLGHEAQDAALFASWGVDYLKYDNCNNQGIPAVERYTAMRDALAATGRPIVYSICNWGQENPWEWGPTTGNLWRTTGDISDSYGSMVNIFHQNVRLASHAGPGGWNDPDMLEIGNGGMSPLEYRSHFSLWAEMAAPLLAGTDLRTASSDTMAILLNLEVIAVDQDPLGIQGVPISSDGGRWVLAKPLASGDVAVVLFNETDVPASISATAEELGLSRAPAYTMRDLWRHATTESGGTIGAGVAPHEARMFRVAPTHQINSVPPQTGVDVATESAWLSDGETATVTATFTNYGRISVNHISLSLEAPHDWTVEPGDRTGPRELPAGQSVRTIWRVTPPQLELPILHGGLTARADYRWRGRTLNTLAKLNLNVASPLQMPYRRFASSSGTARFAQLDNQFGIIANGRDVWTSRDEYGAIYLAGGVGPQTVATVKVTYQERTSDWAKAGIMVRNAIDRAGSAAGYVILVVSPDHGYALQWDSDGNGFLDHDVNLGTTVYPSWLKLVRDGDVFTGYYSTDGSNWNTVGSATIATAATSQDVGMFTTAHNASVQGEVHFADFVVSAD
ncbi:MAG TPA: NEW3 domain-containing protein [Myxococcaceae bacterium]|nr:NEW3 domain-containing protein [Myxococcaceae bacterium]